MGFPLVNWGFSGTQIPRIPGVSYNKQGTTVSSIEHKDPFPFCGLFTVQPKAVGMTYPKLD